MKNVPDISFSPGNSGTRKMDEKIVKVYQIKVLNNAINKFSDTAAEKQENVCREGTLFSCFTFFEFWFGRWCTFSFVSCFLL